MKSFLRLAFLVPALLIAVPASAQRNEPAPPHTVGKPPIRYVTLDKMIRSFAARARAEQGSAAQKRPTILAQR